MRFTARICRAPFFARSPYRSTSVSEPSAVSAAFCMSSGTAGVAGAAAAAEAAAPLGDAVSPDLAPAAGAVGELPHDHAPSATAPKIAQTMNFFMKSWLERCSRERDLHHRLRRGVTRHLHHLRHVRPGPIKFV